MKEHVVVLHGLALNRWWTWGLAASLKRAGYAVHNVSYPSRRRDFGSIVDEFLHPLITSLPSGKLHFVVHSMGGILMRIYARKHGTSRIGRVVMIGTPNGGSEMADLLRGWRVSGRYFGDVGRNLGTGPQDLPAVLGPVPFECGVIAGTNFWLHFPTALMAKIPRPNDGIVSVASTKVAGMKAHTTVWADHSMMVWRPEVWRRAVRFLKAGNFGEPGGG